MRFSNFDDKLQCFFRVFFQYTTRLRLKRAWDHRSSVNLTKSTSSGRITSKQQKTQPFSVARILSYYRIRRFHNFSVYRNEVSRRDDGRRIKNDFPIRNPTPKRLEVRHLKRHSEDTRLPSPPRTYYSVIYQV